MTHIEPADLRVEHSHPNLVEHTLAGGVRDELEVAGAVRELHAAYASEKRLRLH